MNKIDALKIAITNLNNIQVQHKEKLEVLNSKHETLYALNKEQKNSLINNNANLDCKMNDLQQKNELIGSELSN